MNTRRTAKVAEAIREVVSSSILFELRDPRVQNVTVLAVEVPQDLRSAKVSVSVLGDEKETRLCLHGLESSRGFLQRKIADRLDLRYTPVLSFVADDGVKKSIEAARILRALEQERQALEGTVADAADPPPAQDAPTETHSPQDESQHASSESPEEPEVPDTARDPEGDVTPM